MPVNPKITGDEQYTEAMLREIVARNVLQLIFSSLVLSLKVFL